MNLTDELQVNILQGDSNEPSYMLAVAMWASGSCTEDRHKDPLLWRNGRWKRTIVHNWLPLSIQNSNWIGRHWHNVWPIEDGSLSYHSADTHSPGNPLGWGFYLGQQHDWVRAVNRYPPPGPSGHQSRNRPIPFFFNFDNRHRQPGRLSHDNAWRPP